MALSNERLVELVNLALDGQATAEEHKELKAALAESGEARDLDAATRDLIARLDSVHPADVPDALRPAVMEQVRRDGQVLSGPGVRRRRRFAIAWAAAAALVLVFLIVDRPGRVDDEAGAVMAPAAEWPVVATLKADEDAVVVRQKGDLYTLQPRISGPYPVTASLSWDPAAAALFAISAGADASSSVHNAEFILRGAEDRVSVMIRRLGDEPFEIRVAVAGNEVGRVEVPVD